MNEVPTPATHTPATPTPATPAPTPASLKPVARAAISQASEWGRVTADGTVFLKAPEGEVEVGQYAAGSPQDGLTFYARKYDDLVVEIEVIQTRIKDGKTSADASALVVKRVRETLAGRSFVGDIVSLEQMCAGVVALIDEKRVTERARKAALKESARAARITLVEEAETMSDSSSWKSTTERYTAIVEQWKTLPRVDRSAEQEMWKRLSNARTTFDKRRRAHFHELDAVRKEAVGVKRELITRAQAALGTTDPKAGIKKFGDRAIAAMLSEYKQLNTGVLPGKPVFGCISPGSITFEEKRGALDAVNLIKKKRSGKSKGRTCANGSKQKRYLKHKLRI